MAVDTVAPARHIGDFYEPGKRTQGFGIPNPTTESDNFELKPSHINLVKSRKFYGMPSEDPLRHLAEFERLCQAIKVNGIPLENLKMVLFPFSLGDEALHWESVVHSPMVNTWPKVEKEFMRKFFPKQKTIELRQAITNFRQKRDEGLGEAWKRMRGYLRTCPHHGYNQEAVLGIFYEGLRNHSKLDLDLACFGSFILATLEEGERILENFAQSQQYNVASPRDNVQESKINEGRLGKLDDVIRLARRQVMYTDDQNSRNRDSQLEEHDSPAKGISYNDAPTVRTQPSRQEWEMVRPRNPYAHQQERQHHPCIFPGDSNEPKSNNVEVQVPSEEQSKDVLLRRPWNQQPSSSTQTHYDARSIMDKTMKEMGIDKHLVANIQKRMNRIFGNEPPQIVEENHVGVTIGSGEIRTVPKLPLEPEDMETYEETDQIIETTIDQSPGLIEEPEQAVEWTKKLWELEEVPTSLEEGAAEECLTLEVMEQITEEPYQGSDNHNPMDHILKFEDIIRKTGCDENGQEYLRLKFFPLSLEGQAARWDAKFWEEHSVSWEFYKCRFLKNFYKDSIWSQKQDEPERNRKRNRELSPDLPRQSLTAEETTEANIGCSHKYKVNMSESTKKTEPVVRIKAREIFHTGYVETSHGTNPMKTTEGPWHTTDSEQRVLRTKEDHLEPLPILPEPPDADISVVEKHLRCKPSTFKDVTFGPVQNELKDHLVEPQDPQPPRKKRKRRKKKKKWVETHPRIRSPKDKSGQWRHKPSPDPRDEFPSLIEEYTEDPFLDILLEKVRSWDKPYTHPYLST